MGAPVHEYYNIEVSTTAVLGAMCFVTSTLASAIGLENGDELETAGAWPTFKYRGRKLRYGCSGGYCWRDKPYGSWCWTRKARHTKKYQRCTGNVTCESGT